MVYQMLMDLKFAFKSECGWASTPDKGKCKIPKRPAARQMLILYNKLELIVSFCEIFSYHSMFKMHG